jgi:gamma-glutamyl-gamma-aminobutyrate hydrolase PuuD
MMQSEPSNIISIAPPKSDVEMHHYMELFNEYEIKILREGDRVEGALILCGGADIGVNLERDQLEFGWLDEAIQNGIPVLGICRGMQLINHHFGGVVEDVPTELNEDHLIDEFRDDSDHHERLSQFHWVKDMNNGHIFVANSRHHQYCKSIPFGFQVTHFALDHLVEGFINPDLKILGIQWHPERNENIDDLYWKQYPLNQIKKWLKEK